MKKLQSALAGGIFLFSSMAFGATSATEGAPNWVESARGTWKGAIEYATPEGKKKVDVSIRVEPVGGNPAPGADWEFVLQYGGASPVKYIMKRDRTIRGEGHWVIEQPSKIELDAFELPGPTLSMTYYINKPSAREMSTTRYTVLGNVMILTSESVNPTSPFSKTGGSGGVPEIYNYSYINTQYGTLTKK